MYDFTITFLIFFGVFPIIYYLWNRPKRYGKNGLPYPPCLPSVPILGSAPFLPKFQKLPKFFTENFEKYGPVVGFYMGTEFGLILNSKEAMHEAFVKKSADFSSRPLTADNQLLNPGQKGILMHPFTNEFKKYHKLSLNIMREFGLGSRIMENKIQFEIENLIGKFEMLKGQDFQPCNLLTNCSMNIICGILFGERYDENTPNLQKLIDLVHNTFKHFKVFFLFRVFKFLQYVPYFKAFLYESLAIRQQIAEMIEKKIKICTDPAYRQERPNFIDRYIEMEGPGYDKPQLLNFIHDLFIAGTETTAGMFQWSLILLANNSSVQEKMRDEISKVVPNDRLPSLSDKPHLTYVEAFILELMRFKSAAPTTIPHSTTNDCELFGYFIPTDTFVLGNIYSAHFDCKVWGDPDVFKPERFVEDGRIINKDLLVPFSLGKRSCFGEMLARQEMFLFVTSLVQKFKILPPRGERELIVDEIYDVTLKPAPFNIRLADVQES